MNGLQLREDPLAMDFLILLYSRMMSSGQVPLRKCIDVFEDDERVMYRHIEYGTSSIVAHASRRLHRNLTQLQNNKGVARFQLQIIIITSDFSIDGRFQYGK